MKIDIMAGWMLPEEQIGILDITRSHGREVISVEYDRNWLKDHDIMIDPDLALYAGKQYPPAGKEMFGFLSDSSPDRWGRRLIEREERVKADTEKRPVRALNASDYLFGISDRLRYGGLRFKDHDTGRYLSSGDRIPPLTDIRLLEAASRDYETSDRDKKVLGLLLEPGSSLGGARPKANVIDADGSIWIAKFPAKNDSYDIGAWEMEEHELAQKCGLSVPDAKLMKLSEYGSTFLTKRFDRTADERRIHLMSMMTALSMTDGYTDGAGYIDMAGQLEMMSASPESDLRELWKRMAFNILTSDHDDHLRNHGLILADDGWRLSPAYDLNPVPDQDTLSLNITDNDNRRNIENAVAVAELFRVSEKEAENMVIDMQHTISSEWKDIARSYKIPERDIRMMEPAFVECGHSIGKKDRVYMAGMDEFIGAGISEHDHEGNVFEIYYPETGTTTEVSSASDGRKDHESGDIDNVGTDDSTEDINDAGAADSTDDRDNL